MTLRKLDALIHEHFCQFPKAESYVRFVIKPVASINPNCISRSRVHKELDRCKENAQNSVESLLQLESQPLFTQNTLYLQSEEAKWLGHFKFIHYRSPQLYTAVCPPLRPVSPEEEGRFMLSWKPYEDELVVMAHVQAYFRVAYKVR
jgi:hypothetical protein